LGALALKAQRALDLLGLSKAELSILLCGHQRIRTLNRRFRGVDRSTDVLSFPFLEAPVRSRVKAGPLGDIAICVPVARRQARAAGHPLDQEMLMLMVHGLLHLLGHDHEGEGRETRRMKREEKRLLEAMGVHKTMV